ncbi:MAG: carboxypeptidase regulatory-like domain-containing protein, partial [Deinococcus sp.]|nr:carboxypeptidase regulatory-like domain-containing protein [Deinococcus sp.]
MFKRSTLLLVTAVVALLATGCPQPPPPPSGAPGSIAGTVDDANTGVVIPNSSVSLQGPGGTFNALTDEFGDYGFSNILAGVYALVVHADGYNTGSRSVTVPAGGSANGDISLVRNPTRRFLPFLSSCTEVGSPGPEGRGTTGLAPVPGTLLTLEDIEAAIAAGAIQLRAFLEEELEGLTTDPDTVQVDTEAVPADTTDRTSIDEPGRQNLAFSIVSIWFNDDGELADMTNFMDEDMRIPEPPRGYIECRVAGMEVRWQALITSDEFDPCQNDPLFFAANERFCLDQFDQAGRGFFFSVPLGGVIAASDDPGLDYPGLPPAPGSRVVVDNKFAVTLTNDADDEAGNAPFPLSNTTNNTTHTSQNEDGLSWISITAPDPVYVVIVVSWHFPDPQLGPIELGPKKKLVKRFLKIPRLRLDKYDEDNILATDRNQNAMCETDAAGIIFENECQVVTEGVKGDVYMRIRVSNIGREPATDVELTDIMREAGFIVGTTDPSYATLVQALP